MSNEDIEEQITEVRIRMTCLRYEVAPEVADDLSAALETLINSLRYRLYGPSH